MRYLITQQNTQPFFTHWFDADNNYVEGMIVYDLFAGRYMYVINEWTTIGEDSM